MVEEDNNLVFTYGTLKQGHGNYQRLLEGISGVKFLGSYVTPSKYTMYSLGGFPGVREEGNTPITGEVYQIPEIVFKRLDRLEGYPSFYDRKKIPTKWGEAWIYLVSKEYINNHIVISGIW